MNPRNLANRLLIHCLAALGLAVLLMLPDHLYKFSQPHYQAVFSLKMLAILWGVGMLLMGLRYRAGFLAFTWFVALLQLSQFLHFSYFGTQISPHEVIFLFTEWGEISQTLSAVLPYLALPLFFVALTNILAWQLWKRLHASTLRLPAAGLVLLFLLSILPYRASHTLQSQSFYPNPAAYSVRNTLYAVSFFVGHSLRGDGGKDRDRPRFQPYRVDKLSVPAELPIIVVVMGESLTYKHMGIFGYERPTTPELQKLLGDPGFVFHRAIAGGVSTKVSLPSFFNIQREPGNISHLMRYESNLLKLAKERGMRTYYISAQTSNLATYSGSEFADEFITQERMQAEYDKFKDDVLLRQLERIDLSKPAFIVLHQRNSHSPYEQSYPLSFALYPIHGLSQHDYMVNAYDNSIRYTDHLLTRIIIDLKTRAHRPAYLFFTSDHGEMLGEGGKYGHTLLEPDVARVPFLFYAVGGSPAVVKEMRAMQAPTHYEIGKSIARLLGYKVINPNEAPGRFYVNGPDLGGTMGCMAIDKAPESQDGWHLATDELCTDYKR